MAYNNGYPMSYQPYYPQYNMNMQNQQNNGIIWVQGEAGAKSYLVAPGNTIQLWDSESQTIYLKSADASGVPSMKILDYTIRSNTPNVFQNITSGGDNTDKATLKDISALQAQIDEIKQQISKIGDHNESSLQPNAARTPERKLDSTIPAV